MSEAISMQVMKMYESKEFMKVRAACFGNGFTKQESSKAIKNIIQNAKNKLRAIKTKHISGMQIKLYQWKKRLWRHSISSTLNNHRNLTQNTPMKFRD